MLDKINCIKFHVHHRWHRQTWWPFSMPYLQPFLSSENQASTLNYLVCYRSQTSTVPTPQTQNVNLDLVSMLDWNYLEGSQHLQKPILYLYHPMVQLSQQTEFHTPIRNQILLRTESFQATYEQREHRKDAQLLMLTSLSYAMMLVVSKTQPKVEYNTLTLNKLKDQLKNELDDQEQDPLCSLCTTKSQTFQDHYEIPNPEVQLETRAAQNVKERYSFPPNLSGCTKSNFKMLTTDEVENSDRLGVFSATLMLYQDTINDILSLPPPDLSQPDSYFWQHSPSGHYSVKTGYHCWNARNATVFRNQDSRPMRIEQEAQDYLDFYQAAQDKRRTQTQSTTDLNLLAWEPPPVGTLKLNTDAAISTHQNRTGGGALVRDHTGKVLAATTFNRMGQMQPQVAEGWVLLEGLKWSRDNGLNIQHIEVDCKSLLTDLQSTNENLSSYGTIINAIRRMLSSLPTVTLHHTRRQGNTAAHNLAQMSIGV
ncbi:hypothetical protein F8388_011413 [Cannabis sativa]|uniref:RNase H type-1 domain-containing protein n=1 Tax=Cannabis sativa TaxID=3483 RepID=A0A7J6EW92_CANSA|nr:hypothetical protein F8388_011413 [Cannabis sativa]